ncbi:guanine nucleotide binding protein, alpha subunit [Russula vinacea]|nr:guanine nucleotide binding protein, alpha subunit [Russula vinacea]
MAIRRQNLALVHLSNKANCEYIMKHRIDTDSPDFSFLPKFCQAVQDLWAEEIIPVLLDRPPSLSVDDNAAYFFAEAQRVVAEEYVPSTEDILYATERGIMETYFTMDQLSMRVLQVYGQEGEPRKWINLFEGATSIIFYASLSDYNKWVVGLKVQTRLEKSFSIFEAIVNSHCFLRMSVILFLTDRAEFGAKLHEVPLATLYPKYTGGTDVDKGVKFILRRFKQLNRARLPMYPHIREASDMNNIRLLSIVVDGIILRNSLMDANLL